MLILTCALTANNPNQFLPNDSTDDMSFAVQVFTTRTTGVLPILLQLDNVRFFEVLVREAGLFLPFASLLSMCSARDGLDYNQAVAREHTHALRASNTHTDEAEQEDKWEEIVVADEEEVVHKMARTKQTARATTGGKAPRKQIVFSTPPPIFDSSSSSASTPFPSLLQAAVEYRAASIIESLVSGRASELLEEYLERSVQLHVVVEIGLMLI